MQCTVTGWHWQTVCPRTVYMSCPAQQHSFLLAYVSPDRMCMHGKCHCASAWPVSQHEKPERAQRRGTLLEFVSQQQALHCNWIQCTIHCHHSFS
eukprot:2701688-Rhodomonas_salina.1